LLAACFTVLSSVAAAATYFQLQQSTVTVIVEGDKDATRTAAETVFRLQSAARSLLGWPDSYHERPLLVFLVNERLLRHVFEFPPDPTGVYTDANTRHGNWARTPSLTVVAAAMGYERGYEYRSLQRMYGEALLASDTSHDWPKCARYGMTAVLEAAELTPPNHFYLAGSKVRQTLHIWGPEEILSISDRPTAQWVADGHGYSCYRLSFMIASASPQERSALERMLTAVGRGTPLGTATTAELHQTLDEFTARYTEFSHAIFHDISADLPEQIPAMTDPVPITLDRVQTLMETLCAKLKNCRK
jgi:hypothetical protein